MALVVGVCFEGGLFLPLFGDRGALISGTVRKGSISSRNSEDSIDLGSLADPLGD